MTIKEYRTARGLTQQQLADTAGLNRSQIQKLERGEIRIGNITLANAARLAYALGIKIEDLIENQEKP